MKLTRVTISGADDGVDVGELMRLQWQYPFVEWGILVSRKRMGTPRYPSPDWYGKMPAGLNVSLHLCGEICRQVLSGAEQRVSRFLRHDSWRRMQLNDSFKTGDYTLALSRKKWSELMPDKAIILPYNNGSTSNMQRFMSSGIPENIHFLHDQSGGRGTEITRLMRPFNNLTGYAGGINPENAPRIAETLVGMEFDCETWMDMETGVRTDDKFDLDKVEKVLSICNIYVKQ